MFSIIQRKFIKDYQKVDDKDVRERYGTVFSIISILCNIVLVVFKLFVSFITNSVSIRADALNNLSDVGSNVATLFGFKLSNRHSDADHPYGHGRMEYISGLVVSFLILFMGISALIDSLKKIVNPEVTSFSFVAIIVLVASIGVKFVMYGLNNKAGKTINSETLLAAGQDSFNDSIMTFATLVTQLINFFFKLNLDAIVGAIVSIFVLKSGIEIFKSVLDVILGKTPDKEFIKSIEDYILSNKRIIGIHDLMFHDYGPSSMFMTVHAEVDSREDILEIHDLIDNIEEGILSEFNVLTTIHMDPLVTNDRKLNKYKKMVNEVIKDINEDYSIHDFRMVKGQTHTNLIFDVLLPAAETVEHAAIREELTKRIREKDDSLRIVCKIEHSRIG